jgi:hypothetical protein
MVPAGRNSFRQYWYHFPTQSSTRVSPQPVRAGPDRRQPGDRAGAAAGGRGGRHPGAGRAGAPKRPCSLSRSRSVFDRRGGCSPAPSGGVRPGQFVNVMTSPRVGGGRLDHRPPSRMLSARSSLQHVRRPSRGPLTPVGHDCASEAQSAEQGRVCSLAGRCRRRARPTGRRSRSSSAAATAPCALPLHAAPAALLSFLGQPKLPLPSSLLPALPARPAIPSAGAGPQASPPAPVGNNAQDWAQVNPAQLTALHHAAKVWAIPNPPRNPTQEVDWRRGGGGRSGGARGCRRASSRRLRC